MRLCLVIPWNSDEEGVSYSEEHHLTYWRNAYFGLVELATYARGKGHDVRIVNAERDLLLEADGNVQTLLGLIGQKVLAFEPDVVGVTGMTCQYPAIDAILRTLEPLARREGFKCILGGHHARGAPEATLREHPFLDALFFGMAEKSLDCYLSGKPKAEVPGIFYWEGGQILKNKLETVADMREIPWPDWDLLDIAFYTHPCIWLHRSRKTLLRNLDTIVSRGCRFSCNFCGMSGWVGHPQWRPVASVIEYLHHVQGKYGITGTMFQDSSLGNNGDYIVELCEQFIASGLHRKLVWNANLRADQVDESLARLMLKAGCRMVFIGFESASDRILQRMNKRTTAACNERCARALEKAGMPYWASFIAGYPGETAEDLLASLTFARSINPLGGWANEFNPTPGTRIYNTLIREGRLEPPDTPEGWAAIARVGQPGRVRQGYWSAMDPATFRKLTDPFQQVLMRKLEESMERTLTPTQ